MIFKYSLLDILPPGYTGRERVWYGLGMCPHIKLKGILFPGLKRNNIITVDLIRCMIESPPKYVSVSVLPIPDSPCGVKINGK
jgi:hypothetical protein